MASGGVIIDLGRYVPIDELVIGGIRYPTYTFGDIYVAVNHDNVLSTLEDMFSTHVGRLTDVVSRCQTPI